MSSEPNNPPEDDNLPSFLKEGSIAKKLQQQQTGLPEDLQAKVRELAKLMGRPESEVLADLVRTGLAQNDEEIKTQIVRWKVLNSLTLKEVKWVMEQANEVYSVWERAPKPPLPVAQQNPSPQPAPQKEEKAERDMLDMALERVEREALKGLPPVAYAPPQSQAQAPGQLSNLQYVLLYNLGKYALGKLLENQWVGQAIGRVIEEHGKSVWDTLMKILKGLEGGVNE